MKSPNVILTR